MSKSHSQNHPLSQRHFRQVIRRPAALNREMRSVWGVTWRPGGRRTSFLKNLYRPLGSAVMMAQASYPLEVRRDGIALVGISAAIDPATAVVNYDEPRLCHDFHRNPYVGARGPVLDPCDDGRGKRGHGSWLQLALEVDGARQRAVERRYRLPAVPELPQIYLGYGSLVGIPFQETPALRRRAVASMYVEWTADSLEQLGKLSAAECAQQEQRFVALAPDEQSHVLRTVWEAAIMAPSDSSNTTGLWLVPHELCASVYSSMRIYEYFGDLVGANIFNPARQFAEGKVPNPSLEIAAAHGIDLAADLALLADTAEGSPEYTVIEERIVALVPVLRKRVGASQEISDQDLLAAICCYEEPVAIAPSLQSLSEADQLSRMRARLKPHLSECCSDEDVLQAVREPHQPLFASGLCRIQTLYRDCRLPLAETMQFSSTMLQRERMEMCLWFDRENRAPTSNEDAPMETIAA